MSVPGCACTALPSLGPFGKRRLLASALSSTSRRPPWTGIPWHGTLSLVHPALLLWLSVSLSLLLVSLGLSAHVSLSVSPCISVHGSGFLERDGNGLWLVLGKDLGHMTSYAVLPSSDYIPCEVDRDDMHNFFECLHMCALRAPSCFNGA